MKPKNPISESGANLGFDSVVGDAIDAMGMECPEHALKIYKSNQDFKFLLVHPVRNFSYYVIQYNLPIHDLLIHGFVPISRKLLIHGFGSKILPIHGFSKNIK